MNLLEFTFAYQDSFAKCMMRADDLNLHVYPVRTKMTDLSSHICYMDESELKEFLVNKTLLQSCCTDKDELKSIIVNNYSKDEDRSE